MARTWADYINYEMEHGSYDVTALRKFMQGLADGGPTPSGHRTPAVICTLPGGRDRRGHHEGQLLDGSADPGHRGPRDPALPRPHARGGPASWCRPPATPSTASV